MKSIPRICSECNKEFQALEKEVKRGNAKVCSRECARSSTTKKLNERYSLRNKPNVICAYCAKEFYKPVKKQISKSGLFFCSRAHKDLAQTIEFGLTEIHPDHFGTGNYSYRNIARRAHELICSSCGYKKHPEILEVHHKDRDRTNNSINNLVILCPNCHMEDHFLNKDGRWKVNA